MKSLNPFVRTLEELERIHDYKIDAILPDGTHRYWSTHCRHDRHADCSAPTMVRHRVTAGPHDAQPRPVEVHKTPASCKTCSAPCLCSCHKPTEEKTHA